MNHQSTRLKQTLPKQDHNGNDFFFKRKKRNCKQLGKPVLMSKQDE